VDGYDLNPAGQAGGVDVVDGFVDRLEDLAGIFASTHQDDGFDAAGTQGIAVDGEDPGLGQAAHRERADVADEHGHALLRVEYDVADVVAVFDEAGASNGERLLTHPQEGAARVAVVVFDRVGDLPNAEIVLIEPARIDLDLVLTGEAPER